MTEHPITLQLSPESPYWVCPESAQLDLLLLSWRHRSFKKHPIHLFPNLEWTYFVVQKGSPILILESQKSITLRAGEVVLIHPECAYGMTDSRNQLTNRLLWAWRKPSRCSHWLPQRGCYLHWKLDPLILQEVVRIHERCRHEVGNLDNMSNLMLEQLHANLDICLARSLKVEEPKSSALTQLDLAVHWMKHHLTMRNPIASICDYLHMSPSSLNRMFQKYLGVTSFDYYRQLKMELAASLLKEKKMSVKEIAYHLGYQKPNNFSRAYKTYKGETPKVR